MRASKRIAQDILDGVADDGPGDFKKFVAAFSGEDFQEGHTAFMEKRKANFPFS